LLFTVHYCPVIYRLFEPRQLKFIAEILNGEQYQSEQQTDVK